MIFEVDQRITYTHVIHTSSFSLWLVTGRTEPVIGMNDDQETHTLYGALDHNLMLPFGILNR